jgi:DNA-binding MarR family transcriptional regulator
MGPRPASFFDAASEPLPARVAAGLAKVALALRSRAWEEGGRRGLTPTQAQVLTLLRSGRARRVTDLAEAMAVSAATVSDAVATLERKGLLRKGADAADARASVLSLTARGRAAADRTASWPDFLADAAAGLEEAEQSALLRALVKMIRTLQERGQIPVQRMCVTCRYFRPFAHTDARRPHHCAFVDAPFGDAHLRLDCPDHEAAPEPDAAAAWARFVSVPLTIAAKENQS